MNSCRPHQFSTKHALMRSFQFQFVFSMQLSTITLIRVLDNRKWCLRRIKFTTNIQASGTENPCLSAPLVLTSEIRDHTSSQFFAMPSQIHSRATRCSEPKPRVAPPIKLCSEEYSTYCQLEAFSEGAPT